MRAQVEVLFKTQGRIPVFTRPGVVRFTKNHISFAIELAVPIKIYDAFLCNAYLQRRTLRQIVDGQFRQD